MSDWGARQPVLTILVPAAGFGAWQAWWHPWRRRWETTISPSLIWGVGTIALWAGLTLLDPVFYMLLFVVFSLIFTATEIRVATGLTVLLTVMIAVVNITDATDRGAAAGLGLLALISGLIAIAFGRWIHGIIEQSRERAVLIEELAETRAELVSVERAAGAAAERGRWAAEIHDTLAQGFTSIVVLLEAVHANLTKADDAAEREAAIRRIDLAMETARANLAEARNLVSDLGPAALADTSLPDAIRRAGEELATATGADVAFVIDGTPCPIPVDHEVALLRVRRYPG